MPTWQAGAMAGGETKKFMFGGIVIRGDGVGKQLGYPTANLDISVGETGLKAGVYAAYAFLNKKKYQAALAIQEKPEKVEAHLLDYAGPDFYGEYLEVEQGEKVSEMGKYDGEKELVDKIKRDIERVREVLKISNSPNSPNV